MTLFLTHTFYLLTLFILALMVFVIYKKTSRQYRPMLLLFVTLFFFETAEFVLGNYDEVLKYLISIQYLLEALLIVWQAKLLGVFGKRKNLYFWLIYGLVGLSIPAGFDSGAVVLSHSFFRVISSLVIILIAIEMLNRQWIAERSRLFSNPVFQFSIGLIFYYLYALLLEIFTIIGVDSGKESITFLYYFGIALAVITNFIYLRSMLCIPKTK
jgi:hypothetical protein